MKAECVREQELVEAVSSGRWPERCTDELRAHVAACAICADAVQVAQALQEDYASALSDARVPSAGLVWWRAELRLRQEATRTAARPISIIEAIAGACGAGVSLALLSRAAPWLQEWLLGVLNLPLIVALGVIIVLTPVALYFAFSDE